MTMSEAQKQASEIIRQGIIGAWRHVAGCILGGVIAVVSFSLLSSHLMPRDSTDTATERSGMTLHTDALTGCQYLSVPGAGITPRLDSDGLPVCNEEARP